MSEVQKIIPQVQTLPSITPREKSSKSAPLLAKILEQIRALLGEIIGKELTKVKIGLAEKSKLLNKKIELIRASILKEEKVISNGAELDSVQIVPQNNKHPKKFVLFFYGMRDCYEKHLDAMAKLANDTNAAIIAFNYRGVGIGNKYNKAANSAKDLIEDGKEVYRKLAARIRNPNHILFYGHSMGAGVAAEVHRQLNLRSPIISESSFSSFTSAIAAKKGKLIAWLFKQLRWNFDTVKTFERLEARKFAIIANRRDTVVPYEQSSVYKKLKAIFQAKVTAAQIRCFNRIKIGKKIAKDNIHEPSLKRGKKVIENRTSEAKQQIHSRKGKHFTHILASIKKMGLVSYLRHPHQLIMDKNLSKPIENQKAPVHLSRTRAWQHIRQLNKKYAMEDKLAYDSIVKTIKDLLAIC